MRTKKPIIESADAETDPFDGFTIVQPFVFGVYNGSDYRYFWGDNCVGDFVSYVSSRSKRTIVYFHNGGKFDFFFLLPYFASDLLIVHGRILSAKIGDVELRDSWGIFPEPLRNHWKTEIDHVETMARERRDQYRNRIISYLRDDVVSLYQVVTQFHSEFGNRLTIGGTSIRKLREAHPFRYVSDIDNTENIGTRRERKTDAVRRAARFDCECRQFYFGGRNQCFETGWLKGSFKIYDVNNMYSYVMKEYVHPISTEFPRYVTDLDDPLLAFAKIDAVSNGCLPVRTKNGLEFPHGRNTFNATIHEIRAGLETDTLRIERLHYGLAFDRFTTFGAFVDTYHGKRMDSRMAAKKAATIEEQRYHELMVSFYKRVLNSSYGRFAINPENFADWSITHRSEALEHPWQLDSETLSYRLWWKPCDPWNREYVNVATAASITGAARAVLHLGLSRASRPLYCDTDSIICNALDCVVDPSRIGAWKLEADGQYLAVAGKKLYALFAEDDGSDVRPEERIQIHDGIQGRSLRLLKKAHKGSKITPQDIVNIAAHDDVILWKSEAPSFKLSGAHMFVSRKIRRTGRAGVAPKGGV